MHSLSHIYLHIVFCTKNRVPFIEEALRTDAEKYIAGIIRQQESLLLRQYLMPDHYHGLVRLNPNSSPMSLVKAMKGSSSRWLNEAFLKGGFSWQIGYGAFSHQGGNLQAVMAYIENQPYHHHSMNLVTEARRFRVKYGQEWILD